MEIWNLRALGRVRALRRAAKFAFSLVYRHGHVYRIPRGPLSGARWWMHRDHQFWMPLGSYERETASWLSQAILPSSTFFDVGANAGYFTLLGSMRVGATGRVVAFEPVPTNIETVQHQVEVNGCSNVEIVPRAVSDSNGTLRFVVESNNANSHLADLQITHAQEKAREVIEVTTETLDSYVQRTGLRPDVIKVDVEGAEGRVLAGASAVLRKVRPRWLMSTHSDALRIECLRSFQTAGYSVASLAGFEHELIATPT